MKATVAVGMAAVVALLLAVLQVGPNVEAGYWPLAALNVATIAASVGALVLVVLAARRRVPPG